MSLFGLLNVAKPAGVTSRDVVNRVQRLVKPVKVGHAGTLDPLASGVLVLGLGQATRLVEYVQQMPKHYRGTFLLGRTSTTEDVDGEVTLLADAREPSRAALEAAALRLTGEIDQRPPAYSALKVAGQRAYALARKGEAVDLAPRKVTVSRLVITDYAYPELRVDVDCGSGTYVRSLGRDLAEMVGTGAVMSALVRTAIGRFSLDDALDPAALNRERIEASLLPARTAVEHAMPCREVSDADVTLLANGRALTLAPSACEPQVAATDSRGQLLAILHRRPDGNYWPEKVFLGQ